MNFGGAVSYRLSAIGQKNWGLINGASINSTRRRAARAPLPGAHKFFTASLLPLSPGESGQGRFSSNS
jgi:hypothetical protein